MMSREEELADELANELKKTLDRFMRELNEFDSFHLTRMLIGCSVILANRFDTTPQEILRDAMETAPENWERVKRHLNKVLDQ